MEETKSSNSKFRRNTKTVIVNDMEEAIKQSNQRACSLEGGAFINKYLQPKTKEVIGYKVIPKSNVNLSDAIIFKVRKVQYEEYN